MTFGLSLVLSVATQAQSAGTTPDAASAETAAALKSLREAQSESQKLALVTTWTGRASPAFVDPLTEAARDPSPRLQKAAIRGLGIIGTADAAYELDAIAGSDLPPEARMAACEQLASIAARSKSEASIDSLLRVSGNKNDPVALKAKFELGRTLQAATDAQLQVLKRVGSEDLATAVAAEQASRQNGVASGGAGTGPVTPKPVNRFDPIAGFSDQDQKILSEYSKARCQQITRELKSAYTMLKGKTIFGNRATARQTISNLTRERVMLTSGEPAKVGLTIYWTGLAAAERAGFANAAANGYDMIRSVMPDHVIVRTEDGYGNVTEGYDAGVELGNLFLGMAVALQQAEAQAAASKAAECQRLLQALSPTALEKINEMRLRLEKPPVRR